MSFQNCKVHSGVTDPKKYHTAEFQRGDKRLPMSPSSLKAFGQCPARWMAGYESPDSDAKDFGNLLDTLALTPELFESRYAVHAATYFAEGKKKGESETEKPWNWNATLCKEWREEQGDKEIVSPKELAETKIAANALLKDEVIKSFCDASDKQVMVSGAWKDEATGLVIPVRCLMDFVPRNDTEFYKSLGDLKSTRSAALQPFSRFCFQMGYHVQAAFDLDLYVAATGEDRCNWGFILLENYPPYQTGKRILSQEFIQIGRQTYQHLLARYARCLKTGQWPDYDENNKYAAQGWSIISPEPWQEFDALSEALETAQENEIEKEEELEGITP